MRQFLDLLLFFACATVLSGIVLGIILAAQLIQGVHAR